VRVAGALLAGDEVLLVGLRAPVDRLAGDRLEHRPKARVAVDARDEVAVGGDRLARHHRHRPARVVGGGEAEVSPLGVVGEQPLGLPSHRVAELLGQQVGERDDAVPAEAL
jgi:hypothetical protein